MWIFNWFTFFLQDNAQEGEKDYTTVDEDTDENTDDELSDGGEDGEGGGEEGEGGGEGGDECGGSSDVSLSNQFNPELLISFCETLVTYVLSWFVLWNVRLYRT